MDDLVGRARALATAEALLNVHGERGLAYDLIHAHRGAMARLDAPTLEAFGRGITAWWSVDHFALSLGAGLAGGPNRR